MLTYHSKTEALVDRDTQRRLMRALEAAHTALRRDECGAWRINGTHGHVYTWGDDRSWLLYVASGSPRKWTEDKKRLSFCRVTQDGDDEGCLRLFALPTATEAAAIRRVLGIRRRPRPFRGSYAQISADRPREAPESHPGLSAAV